jgi:hypothetical protein
LGHSTLFYFRLLLILLYIYIVGLSFAARFRVNMVQATNNLQAILLFIFYCFYVSILQKVFYSEHSCTASWINMLFLHLTFGYLLSFPVLLMSSFKIPLQSEHWSCQLTYLGLLQSSKWEEPKGTTNWLTSSYSWQRDISIINWKLCQSLIQVVEFSWLRTDKFGNDLVCWTVSTVFLGF